MNKKEVYFYNYCPMCKLADEEETHPTCAHCLNAPFNNNTHKPVDFKASKQYYESLYSKRKKGGKNG